MTEPTNMSDLIRQQVAATVVTTEIGEDDTFGDTMRGALRNARDRAKGSRAPEATSRAKSLENALRRRSGGDG